MVNLTNKHMNGLMVYWPIWSDSASETNPHKNIG
jgi:hypothetical protein